MHQLKEHVRITILLSLLLFSSFAFSSSPAFSSDWGRPFRMFAANRDSDREARQREREEKRAALAAQRAKEREERKAARKQAAEKRALGRAAALQQREEQRKLKKAKRQEHVQKNVRGSNTGTATRTQSDTSSTRNSSKSARIGYSSPYLGFTPKHPDNCVLFLREDMHVSLPTGLDTWAAKKRLIRSSVARPKKGMVAIIQVASGQYANIGHVALVTDVTDESISILEANFGAERVQVRKATASSIKDAEKALHIVGYYIPN